MRAGISQPLRQALKNALSHHPRLFLRVYRLMAKPQNKELLIGRDTEIVIEGFPRSANTFAVIAFESCQNRKVTIAHHLHSEAHILEGQRRGLPCLVLIRNPEDAIRSLRVALPDTDEGRALKRWIRFYEAVERVKDRVVIANFDTIRRDFGSVIEAVNLKFGTDFVTFQHTAGNVENVFRLVSEVDQQTGGAISSAGAIPTPQKGQRAKLVEMRFNPKALARARGIYARLCEP